MQITEGSEAGVGGGGGNATVGKSATPRSQCEGHKDDRQGDRRTDKSQSVHSKAFTPEQAAI